MARKVRVRVIVWLKVFYFRGFSYGSCAMPRPGARARA